MCGDSARRRKRRWVDGGEERQQQRETGEEIVPDSAWGDSVENTTEERRYKRETGVETGEEIARRSYGSQLRYECGLARKFLDAVTGENYTERWMSCNWNNSWTQPDSLDTCVWVQCISPPRPTNNTQLFLQWQGEPVEFYSNVSYVCREDELYFEWDREMVGYNVSCQEGGGWDEPGEWPLCVRCKSSLPSQ